MIFNTFFGTRRANLFPISTAMREAEIKAIDAPMMTDAIFPLSAAMEKLAICVLSPSSARNTRKKVEKKMLAPLTTPLALSAIR